MNTLWKFLESLYHVLSLQKNDVDPFLNHLHIVKFFKGLLLRKQVDIVRVLDFVEKVYNLLARKRHAQTDCRTSPSLAHGVENNDVRELGKAFAECTHSREVAVSLINDNNAIKP